MPVLSRFFGIVIFMHWNDHFPPHFHAKYGDFEVMMGLDGVVIEGAFPRRAMGLIQEWRAIIKKSCRRIGSVCNAINS